MLGSDAENGAGLDAVAGDLPFEAALAELERIVRDMEGGELSLEASIAAYRRGGALLAHCRGQLGEAERRIKIFEDGALREAADPDAEARP
ncbi:MAG: exodeoxyribonuclease VII small subunit [Candidatus Accumulibacter sp.]|nr:exodeoxyribonuclease VII small subunit [Accumulibacter sp.]